MTGGRQVFVPEVLGVAYDSQAEHLLRGDSGVDVEAIRHEAMIVGGQVRMYFGPFPACVRIPLNLIYPAGRGRWSRLSGFCAGVLAISAFAGLVSSALRQSPLSARWRAWLGNACVIGFAFASPLLLLLGNVSIYNEAIVWGFASSMGALFFLQRSRETSGPACLRALLAFSVCAGVALLSRVTFGVPFLLIAPLLAWDLRKVDRAGRFAAIFGPLGLAVGCHLLLSYARFGSFLGVSYAHYINPVHRDFAQQFGVFSLRRVPRSFADYFGFRFPGHEWSWPFLHASRHNYTYPGLYSVPVSETYLPVTWASAWLVFGALAGGAILWRRGRAAALDCGIAGALFTQVVCVLSFHALAQRYTADLYPFLIVCFLIFLRNGTVLARSRHLLIVLIVLSSWINSLATVSWLADADQNVPAETRAAWKTFLGR